MDGYHLKIVFDTNIFFAAIAKPEGHMYGWVFDSQKKEQYTVFVSEAILLELQEKVEEKLEYSREQSNQLLSTLREICTLVIPKHKVTSAPDVDDNIIFECALEAKADCLFTADKLLLKVKEFEGTKILHPTSLKYIFNLK
jgi:putative PIN family toxin of toxin-antitoxin system